MSAVVLSSEVTRKAWSQVMTEVHSELAHSASQAVARPTAPLPGEGHAVRPELDCPTAGSLGGSPRQPASIATQTSAKVWPDTTSCSDSIVRASRPSFGRVPPRETTPLDYAWAVSVSTAPRAILSAGWLSELDPRPELEPGTSETTDEGQASAPSGSRVTASCLTRSAAIQNRCRTRFPA